MKEALSQGPQAPFDELLLAAPDIFIPENEVDLYPISTTDTSLLDAVLNIQSFFAEKNLVTPITKETHRKQQLAGPRYSCFASSVLNAFDALQIPYSEKSDMDLINILLKNQTHNDIGKLFDANGYLGSADIDNYLKQKVSENRITLASYNKFFHEKAPNFL